MSEILASCTGGRAHPRARCVLLARNVKDGADRELLAGFLRRPRRPDIMHGRGASVSAKLFSRIHWGLVAQANANFPDKNYVDIN